MRIWHWLRVTLSTFLVALLSYTALAKTLPQWQAFANGAIATFLALSTIAMIIARRT